MPKVLIVTGDAAESLEVIYPYQRLLEESHEDEESHNITDRKRQFRTAVSGHRASAPS